MNELSFRTLALYVDLLFVGPEMLFWLFATATEILILILCRAFTEMVENDTTYSSFDFVWASRKALPLPLNVPTI